MDNKARGSLTVTFQSKEKEDLKMINQRIENKP